MLSKRTISCMSLTFPEDVYDSAWAQVTGEEDPGSSGNISNSLQEGYTPENYLSSSSSVYTIDTGKTRGTMFKIDTGGYVFSCLFDSGAEISCMNMENSSHTWSDITDNTQFYFSKYCEWRSYGSCWRCQGTF